jgi:hypothetical protein
MAHLGQDTWREVGHEEHMANARKAFDAYRGTLPEHRRVLLDHYELLDIAVKVVGVGSVGTTCAVMLLMARENDPLFLQVKEARRPEPPSWSRMPARAYTRTTANAWSPVASWCRRRVTCFWVGRKERAAIISTSASSRM